QDPGSNGRDLRTLRLDVVNVTGPVYKFPAEPLRNVPQADPQNPIVPARDNRYRQPPCDGLRNAEFVALCLQSYDSSYSANFTLSYRTYYSSAYRTSFAVAAAATYDEAFSQDVPAESARGRGIGAEHMGALKGFSDRLAQASAEQYARGAELLTKDLESGHLVIPRSVLLEEASGDGVLQPGESMKLTLVIDNLGKLSSPLEGVSVKVTNSSNAKSITVPLRSLPALAPETRTTLKGVISATSSAMFAGDDVRLEGAIQILKDDGSSEEIFSFTATKATHFPVELISIETSAPLAVNKWTSVPFKFQNLSSKPTAEQKVRASTKPKNVEVDNKNGFIVPALNVGESTIITLPVMPSVWAGGTPVVFSAETIDATGAVLVEQRLKKNLEISRSGKLNLLTAAGQPSDGTPIVVAAGSMVKFNVQFQFLSTTERGPFVFRYAQSSDSEIKPWNSTTRIDYGMVWPGRNPKPEPFSFQIPASLKGKTAWIALALDEGGVPIHMLQVWLDVR
ncbi:MAG: hypothetical protein NTV34_06000, partial [Proteobacteria bacterium]|nr:hypothetical protein [Pseudomonadota bacterium]